MIDIGGGSTELLVGQDGKVFQAVSTQIGAVRLAARLRGVNNPDTLLDAAGEVLRTPLADFTQHGSLRWVGVGGTITTLAAMTKQVDKYAPDAIENYPLSEQVVFDWLHRLCAMPLEQRYQLIGLSRNRADIIPFGTAILAAAMRITAIPCIYASDHDNLEGYIRKLFG